MLLRAVLLSSLAVLIASGSGCGTSRVARPDRPETWPLRAGVAVVASELPTVLVRLPDTGAASGDGERALHFARAYPKAFLDSGLFASVAHQVGQEAIAIETDYVVDVWLGTDMDTHWYSVVGALTLGALPIVYHDDFLLRCTVRDRAGRVLGEVVTRDYTSSVLWTPLFPFNLAASAVPAGRLLGVDISFWGAEEEEFLYWLTAHALADAQREVGFRASRG